MTFTADAFTITATPSLASTRLLASTLPHRHCSEPFYLCLSAHSIASPNVATQISPLCCFR
jgi:hypothetical protein